MFRRIFLTRNLALWDRALRSLPALFALYLWSVGQLAGVAMIAFAVLSGLLLITTITGTCSIYGSLGWSTLKRPRA